MADSEEVYRRARAKYAVAHMNNAKWVELFTACVGSGVVIATRVQDIGRLCAALEAVGSFPIVERDDGLTIVAYE